MYVNHVIFKPALWRVEGDFVAIGAQKDFGQVWKTTFKTTTYGIVDISFPCGTKKISHGEACAWFEGTWNFVAGSICDGR
jgi:hypothetical protein